MKTIRIFQTMCLIISMSVYVNAQTVVVKGKVTDENNQVIAGVSVKVKNTSDNTFTNQLGEYKISTEKGKILEFCFLGYVKKEVKVNSTHIDVKLTPDIVTLNECVTVGYGVATDKVKFESAGCVSSSNLRIGYNPNLKQVIKVVQPQILNYPENEEYALIKENRFVAVSSEALSTFSLDVDAASYGNIRRIINQGQIPGKDAVRIEEMINYFSYNYPKPTGDQPVSIITETAICPWNIKHNLVRIGIKAKEIPAENLPVSNFVFLIDVSGSMQGANRLELVKSSLKLLTNNLRENDKVSIVVYAGSAGEVLPSTTGSNRQKIKEAIENLSAGGSTAGGAGIQLAYKIAEKNFIKNGNNRIILCTDGDFNVGVSNVSELENLIESKRKTGIYLTVLGYGMGNYKDNKLQTLAEKGNGNHAYIDNIQEANKVLVNEFGSTMFTVAKDVKLQIEFNPANVNAYRLIGYESRLLNREDFNDDTKDAGELGSGHTVTALYEIIPVGVENNYGGVDELKYQNKVKPILSKEDLLSSELLTVKLRYKKPDENISKKMEVPVLTNNFKHQTSDDFKFIMAVTMFGQLLRDSDFKGTSDYEKVIALAKSGLSNDENGYRREFVRLAETVNQLNK